jgi:hypothetical protein
VLTTASRSGSPRAARARAAGLALAAIAGCAPRYEPRPAPPAPASASAPAAAPATPGPAPAPVAPAAPVDPAAIAAAKAQLVAKHGQARRGELERAVDQVASLWRATDGDLAAFCVAHFAPDAAARDALFARLQAMLEQLDGHLYEVARAARWGADVDTGAPPLPVDALLAAYDPTANASEDLFASKVAFVALLNFPLTTLAERARDGASYSRRQWAEAALASRFDRRVPAALAMAKSAAEAAADQYIAGYNLWMHHVLGPGGERRFPAGKRLISHWNLRDEIKASYAERDGLARQRTIAQVMDRIVTQTIPRAVIDNPRLDWEPVKNTVAAAPPATIEPGAPADRARAPLPDREPDTRFEHVLANAAAARALDPFTPLAPTALARAFDGARIPEARVRALLVEVLGSPLAPAVAREIERRLGRKLEPHDLWYELDGGTTPEAELDAVTRKRYPTAAAFAQDLPRILRQLGFTDARARYLAERIAVDPSRGAGHAMEARRRGDLPRLRTRVERGGMDYKGYHIAVHELGHNVEQVLSLYDVDYTLLAGVPNTAFTEALAFLFQARDLELLGRPAPGAEAARARVLDAFWSTWEIAGSALVELDVWRWLAEHPGASPAQLREATVAIARATWNQYYAPALGGRDAVLLGIYSHTIATPLYLFNYVLGHLIAFQVEEHLSGSDAATFAREIERVSRLGAILPDRWMIAATGQPVGAGPLLTATARALQAR